LAEAIRETIDCRFWIADAALVMILTRARVTS
jgi:hypothetical protein